MMRTFKTKEKKQSQKNINRVNFSTAKQEFASQNRKKHEFINMDLFCGITTILKRNHQLTLSDLFWLLGLQVIKAEKTQFAS